MDRSLVEASLMASHINRFVGRKGSRFKNFINNVFVKSNDQRTAHDANFCLFMFIPSCYMFRPIILTLTRHRQNTGKEGRRFRLGAFFLQPVH